jgi:hypothetical protein
MTTHEEALALARREFPDYPAEAIPDMSDLPWLEAQFWHNDAAPIWAIGEASDIGIGFCALHPDPAQRTEEGQADHPRFQAWYGEDNLTIVSTDDLEVAKAALREAALADRFTAVLREWLTKAEFAEMLRRNEGDPRYAGDSCASHDFCDANEAMAEAWADVIGGEIDLDSDAETAIWNAAWRRARGRGLGWPRGATNPYAAEAKTA